MSDHDPTPEPAGSDPSGDPFGDSLDGPDWARPTSLPKASSASGSSGASGSGGGGGRTRVKVSRRKRRVLRRRRRIGWVLIGLGALLVIGGIWLVVTGLMARGQLNTARAEVHTLRGQISAGQLDAARHTARELVTHASRARSLTTGPAWAIGAALPGGGPIQSIRGITAGVDRLGRHVLPAVIDASRRLDPSTLRRSDGSIDLAPVASVAPELNHASAVMDSVTQHIAALPASTWLPAADHARADLLGQLTDLGHTLRSADLAARVLPPMLGADGPRRYFVAFQNEAEARGTGGLPGAFAIVSADHGTIRFERFESDQALLAHGQIPTGLNFGPDYAHLYDGANTTSDYRNSNLSPNFPYAARIWLAMWHKETGEKLDGAVAVDPTALSYLLAVTGPATLPDGTRVGANNVVALTQSTVYAKFPSRNPKQNAARKQYLLHIAKAASAKILDAHGDSKALVKAAGRAAGERRLLVWSAHRSVEAQLAKTSVAGIIPKTSAPYVGLFVVNDGGNKLDYYLDRSLSWRRSGCRPTRQVTVTIKLTNNAPAHGLSKYVTARSDRHTYPTQPGDNRLEVNYIATDGAQMRSVTIDGKPATASDGVQSGHPLYTVDVEMPRGRTRTVVLHLVEPDAAGRPIVLRQPLVRPLTVHLDDAGCG